MALGFSALQRLSGAFTPTLIALSTLGGLVAAALLLVGLEAFERPASPAQESARIPTATVATQQKTESRVDYTPPQQAPAVAVSDWSFEAAAPRPASAPGPKRPDRLSGPDGWTYPGTARGN